MIAFPFELRPLDDVVPWGGDPPTLHWFGLTDGWFGLEVAGHQLLRTTEPDAADRIEYQVARLWEDVAELVPAVLEPVPADLVAFVASQRASWVQDPPDDDEDDCDAAAIWHGNHRLDLGYLREPPGLAFWSTVTTRGDEVTVNRRHPDPRTADAPGHWSVPTEAFVAAAHALDRDLIAAMADRVTELGRRGGLPRVDLDLPWLRSEHAARATAWQTATARTPTTDWDAVRRGARLLLPPGA